MHDLFVIAKFLVCTCLQSQAHTGWAFYYEMWLVAFCQGATQLNEQWQRVWLTGIQTNCINNLMETDSLTSVCWDDVLSMASTTAKMICANTHGSTELAAACVYDTLMCFFNFRRATMHKRDLCRRLVSVHLSVTFVYSVETNEDIFKKFHHRLATVF